MSNRMTHWHGLTSTYTQRKNRQSGILYQMLLGTKMVGSSGKFFLLLTLERYSRSVRCGKGTIHLRARA